MYSKKNKDDNINKKVIRKQKNQYVENRHTDIQSCYASKLYRNHSAKFEINWTILASLNQL